MCMCLPLVLKCLAGKPKLHLIDDLCTEVKLPFWGEKLELGVGGLKMYDFINITWYHMKLIKCGKPFFCSAIHVLNFIHFVAIPLHFAWTLYILRKSAVKQSLQKTVGLHFTAYISAQYNSIWVFCEKMCAYVTRCLWNEAVTCSHSLHVGLELLCMIFRRGRFNWTILPNSESCRIASHQ